MIEWYWFRFGTYWSTMASGELAIHLATISGRTTPFSVGKSKNFGGFLGFGDQAAASADSTLANPGPLAPRRPPADPSAVAAGCRLGAGRAAAGLFIRQHELIA